MTGEYVKVNRAEIAQDLERARLELHRLLALAGPEDWDRPTHGTRWTNEQLLFHMVFGYMVVQRLLILVRVFSRLPDPVSRVFANGLDSATKPFHLVNYIGSCSAALVYNRRRMGPKLDRVVGSLHRSLYSETDAGFARGMHYPVRWDPFFEDFMTVEDVYRYPGRHFDFHAQQLTLTPTH
jgi:hypothetical protein